MKTDFKFIGANTNIRVAELVLYEIEPNESFKHGEIVTISSDNPRIHDKETYEALVALMRANGNFKEVKNTTKNNKKIKGE